MKMCFLLLIGFMTVVPGLQAVSGASIAEKKLPLHSLTKIIGGTETSIDKYPFLVSVQRRGSHDCGGSLLQPDWILSVAHCCYDMAKKQRRYDANTLSIVAGLTKVNKVRDTNSHYRIVYELYPHKDFDKRTFHNDIALLRVYRGFVIGDEIRLAPLPTLGAFDAEPPLECQVVGWGQTVGYRRRRAEVEDNIQSHRESVATPITEEDGGITETTDAGNVPDNPVKADLIGQLSNKKRNPLRPTRQNANNLNVVTVPVLDINRCYFGVNLQQDKQICAASIRGGKDACRGDSGGPIICRGVQMGLTSWGIGCGQAGNPGIYTRLDYYLDWINATVEEHALDVLPPEPSAAQSWQLGFRCAVHIFSLFMALSLF